MLISVNIVNLSNAPGTPLEIRVRASGAFAAADFVQLHADAVGKLRGFAYASWTLPRTNPGQYEGTYPLPNSHPEALMEIFAMRFANNNGSGVEALAGQDYSNSYFEVTLQPRRPRLEELAKAAAELKNAREAEFLSGWGTASQQSMLHHVFFFYRNCLVRGGDLGLERTRVLAFEGTGADDVLNLVEKFFKTRTRLANVSFANRDELNSQFKSDSPWMAFYFPNVAAETTQSAFAYMQPFANILSLLMSSNTGSAPEFVGAGIFGQQGTFGWLFARRRYAGNLLAPLGPDDCSVNRQFEHIRTRADVQFYLSLHRDATREENADVQYFRYWTLLEAIARGQGRHTGERGVRDLIHEHELRFNVGLGITVNGEHFTPERCISVWVARRNITAHFGAFDSTNQLQRQERKSFEVAVSAQADLQRMQHDFYLGQLKEVSKMIINSLLR